MTLRANQPSRGAQVGKSRGRTSAKGQAGFQTGNSLAKRKGGAADARSDHTPRSTVPNRSKRIRPEIKGQLERGTVRNEKASRVTVVNTTAGRLKKIKG